MHWCGALVLPLYVPVLPVHAVVAASPRIELADHQRWYTLRPLQLGRGPMRSGRRVAENAAGRQADADAIGHSCGAMCF